jgi:hypothetical protein
MVIQNTIWLTAFCYANPLFLMRISFFIYTYFFNPTFPGTQQGCKTRAGCTCKNISSCMPVRKVWPSVCQSHETRIAQQHYVWISYTKFYQSQTMNAESTHISLSLSLLWCFGPYLGHGLPLGFWNHLGFTR